MASFGHHKEWWHFWRSLYENDERSSRVTLFADDVFEKSLLEKGTGDECEHAVVKRMGDVNSALETCGLRQNAGKLVILPNLRRTVENRTMLSMGAEIDQRIWATNRAWREIYGMWWNKKVPYKIKRTLFRGAVSLTCLTALLLHDRDYLRLQRCLEKKLRALMLGTASWEGPDHTRTLSSRQVWKRWRLAPPAYELCVQRLGWYQSTAREPARHAVGWGECTSKRTIRLSMVNVCIPRQTDMRNDY